MIGRHRYRRPKYYLRQHRGHHSGTSRHQFFSDLRDARPTGSSTCIATHAQPFIPAHYLLRVDWVRVPRLARSCHVTPAVHINEEGVGQELSDGTCCRVKWTGLTEVSVVVISEQQGMNEIYFHLVSEEGMGRLVPYGPYGTKLFDRLIGLPGFDMDVTLRAMLSSVNARVVCWRRGRT